MATKVKALQMWCKKMAEGYRDVDVKDMTTSWKNGLAFCAIIHRFRPDLIDYDSLSKENIFDNNQLAFDVAEKELGIPAFLDAPDMVAIRVPDKLSIVTYVSQYYNYFHDKPQLGGPGVSKPSTLKPQQTSTPSGPDPKRQSLTPSDGTPNKDRQVSMGDKCSICHKKVYLLERHMADGCLYHRSCFKSSDKSPASKILNKSNVISDKDSDKKSVQNEKSEVPDFWKRRAEAKKAEMKSDDILTDKEKEKDPDHRTNINDDSKDKSVPFWKKSRPDDLKLDSNGNEKQNAQLDKVNKKDNADTIITPQPRARRVVKIGAHIDKKEEEPMDTSNCTISSETSGRGPGNILNKQNITPKSDIKKEEEISEYKNPRARRVVKIGAPKEKKDEEPMDTSISMVSSELNIKDPGNILNKPQAAPRVNNKKVDEISENKAPRARHVVKIVAKKEEDSAVSYKDRSPVQTNRVTSVLTPDTSPPPLPSSAPPPVKFQSPSSPPPLPSNLPPQLPLSNKSSTENIFSSKNRTSPLRPASTPVQISPSQPHKEGISQSRKSSSSILDSKEQKKDNPDKVASLMSPTKKDGKVLGGLLKNLAGIRQKKSSESEDKSPLSPTKGFKSNLATTKEESVKKREVKSCDIDVEKKSERTAKAKSANFVTGKMSVFSKDTAESTISAKSKKETSVLSNDNDDMPAWKKALEERKRNRPKSADLLSETSQVPSWKKNQNQAGRSSPNRPKSMDVLSEKDNEKDDRPAWQIEAEKKNECKKEWIC